MALVRKPSPTKICARRSKYSMAWNVSPCHKDLRQALKIFDGLECFALPNIKFADGHQGDLILRLVLQDVLVLRNGLGNLALVQQLLCGFDEFALVIGHA